MAVVQTTVATQAAFIGTEHTLATISSAGVYQLNVSLVNMQGGPSADVVEIRSYMAVTSAGDTLRLHDIQTYKGAQGLLVARTYPEMHVNPVKYTLKQTEGGSAKSFPWSIYEQT